MTNMNGTRVAHGGISQTEEASVAANFVSHFAFQQRFGTLKLSDHQVIAFCNMGGSTREEELRTRFQARAEEMSWTVTGTSYCDDGDSWVVVLHGWDADGERVEEADIMSVYDPLISEVWAF